MPASQSENKTPDALHQAFLDKEIRQLVSGRDKQNQNSSMAYSCVSADAFALFVMICTAKPQATDKAGSEQNSCFQIFHASAIDIRKVLGKAMFSDHLF
jgi:hypothetical protein